MESINAIFRPMSGLHGRDLINLGCFPLLLGCLYFICVLLVDISPKYRILAGIETKLESESRLGKKLIEYRKNCRYITKISENVDISKKYRAYTSHARAEIFDKISIKYW